MKIYKNTFTVGFCHCDPAGIVYYPNFYTWFDQSTERMLRSMGFAYSTLPEKHGIVGFPLLETGSTYHRACRIEDELVMESGVDEHDEKTFRVCHKLYHADGKLALEGFERRITVARRKDRRTGFGAVATPLALRKEFAAD